MARLWFLAFVLVDLAATTYFAGRGRQSSPRGRRRAPWLPNCANVAPVAQNSQIGIAGAGFAHALPPAAMGEIDLLA